MNTEQEEVQYPVERTADWLNAIACWLGDMDDSRQKRSLSIAAYSKYFEILRTRVLIKLFKI